MLRSERMVSTAVICTTKHVEKVLEALSSFGEFQIETSTQEQPTKIESETIQQSEEALSTINDLNSRLIPGKTSILDIFKPVEYQKTTLTAENWQQLLESTRQQIFQVRKQVEENNLAKTALDERNAELYHLRGMLLTIRKMGANLSAIEELKLIKIEIASVPHKNYFGLETALSKYPLILNRCYLFKKTDFVFAIMPAKLKEEVDRILKIHHAEIFQLPDDLPPDASEALQEVNDKINETKNKEKDLIAELNKISHENRSKLPSWKETIDNILALLNAKKKIAETERLATLHGFVPKKRLPQLTKKVDITLEGKALVLPNAPAKDQDPPTKLRHGRLVRPFEEITKLYGLPHYDELDPTPLIAISFPLIFGLMFGDIGQGLIFLIGGLLLGSLIKRNQAIKNMCYILAACGAGAIIAGALYGEVFGKELFTPLWFSPFNSVFTFLLFSLAVGIIQIMSGLVLELVDFIFRNNLVDATLTSLPKIAFYGCAVYLIVVYQLNLAIWFTGPILLLIIPFLVLVFAKPSFLLIQRAFMHAVTIHEKPSLGQRLFESGDFVTRLLSNSISYTRILALLMAHWALLLVTYTIAELVGTGTILTLILSGVIIVGGNIFVMALEGLIVFIHTIRLHFYEWFSKFYDGTGTPFQPFKQKHDYTEGLKKP